MSSRNRFSLDTLGGRDPEGRPYTTGGKVSVEDYSNFKYGDGVVAKEFGIKLADAFADAHDELDGGRILVTSSAFKVAPPASDSILRPFATQLQNRLGDADVETFQIKRTYLTQGDYATMSAEERDAQIKRNSLRFPEGLDVKADAFIGLDDILVTGSHEGSVQGLFDRNGVDTEVYHTYLLTATEGLNDPTIEAAVNHCAIRSLGDVARLANTTDIFVPNARLCKMIVSADPEEVAEFTNAISDVSVLETLRDYIAGDELEQMPGYTEGVRTFARAVLTRVSSDVRELVLR